MAKAIDELTRELAEEHGPRSGFEWFLVREIGRTTVQYEHASDLLVQDAVRVAQRAEGLAWDSDRRGSADRLGGRIRNDPRRIADELATTAHGAAWLLFNWEGLGDSLRSNGRFTEPQRELAYDLLGIPEVLRPGSVKVPAADDAVALGGLVEREIERLNGKLLLLATEDGAARRRAIRGVPTEPDSETRRLRASASRSHGRLKWAKATLDALRRGADPATLIDPETKLPIESWGPSQGATAKPGPTSGPQATATAAGPRVPASWAEVSAARPARDVSPIREELPPETRQDVSLLRELMLAAQESGQIPVVSASRPAAAAQAPPPPAA
jgi:hypothetical protein